MNQKKKITILGLGNILLGDEGFGVHFIKYFYKKYNFYNQINIIDGGVLGYELLNIITNSNILYVIDTIQLKTKPGSIYRFTYKEMQNNLIIGNSTHDITFMDVLLKAEIIQEIPAIIIFLCIVPNNIHKIAFSISNILQKKLLLMESFLLKELKKIDISPL